MALLVPLNPLVPVSYQIEGKPYAQGINAIINEIALRLKSLSVGAVWPFLKWIKSNPSEEEWQKAFMVSRADGRNVVWAWLINSKTSPGFEVSDDDSSFFTCETTITLEGFLEIEDPYTWDLWNSVVRRVTSDLIRGDRTFNSTCVTHSIPTPSESMRASFGGIDCHSTTIEIIVQESSSYTRSNTEYLTESIPFSESSSSVVN